MIGTVDAGGAHGTAHAGAVYVHRGETWLVESLDLEERVAVMTQAIVDYSTTAREITDITDRAESARPGTGRARAWRSARSRSRTRSCPTSPAAPPAARSSRRSRSTCPPRTLRTTAVWWTMPAEALAEAGLATADLPGAAHAAEHCAIGLLPLFATCDRWDIGGVSTAQHPDTGRLTVFVYDGHPGGAGFSERGYRAAAEWLAATRETIASCDCPEGCPSCIQSPKCGNQNSPLDKAGAVLLLDTLLAGRGLH